jgi:hypothetical protein
MSTVPVPPGSPSELHARRPTLAPETPAGTVELRLTVGDPDVVADLLRRPEGPARDRFAAAALRIGVLALRMAGGQVDGDTIRAAGERMLGELRELLAVRAGELSRQLGETLTRYLDPQAGLLPQRLDALVRADGELERLLRRHLGPDESLLAHTLAEHLGKNAPLLRLLAPDDANGLRAQVEGALRAALLEQREQILREFSLDNRESALSRLVAELRARQGELQQDVRTQVEGVVREFSLDREDSALSRLVARVDAAQRTTSEQNREFQTAVRETLKVLETRREEQDRSTRHGATFEAGLGEVLAAEAQRLGDVLSSTGNTVGLFANCKVGDFVIQLGPESAAPDARIAWEAKEARKVDLKAAREECEKARKNRQAQIGVFVFSRRAAPDGLLPLARYGADLVVVWDAEDPATDVYLRAAYSVARALTVRERSATDESREALDEVDRAARAVEKQVAALDEVRTWGETARSSGEKIVNRATLMAAELRKQVERLDRQVAALRSVDP